MSPTLYELAAEWEDLDIALAASGGELTPEITEWLEAHREALLHKADGIGGYWAELDHRIDGLKAEEARLAERRRVEERKRDVVIAMTTVQMQRMATRKLTGQYHDLTIVRHGGARKVVLQETDPFKFPPELRREVPATVVVDAAKLRASLEARATDDRDPVSLTVTIVPEEADEMGATAILATLSPRGESLRRR